MEILRSDLVIIGSGIAGLSTALECDGMEVSVVTKASLDEGANSFYAQGGLAAAVRADDSPRLHAEDTVFAGAGLSDDEVTQVLTQEASEAVDFLREIGTKFDLDSSGQFALSLEAAHQRPRVLHANRDATGAELMRALGTAVRRAPNIKLIEHAEAIEILIDNNGAVNGVVLQQGDELMLVATHKLVLATGGAGQLFEFTTNPSVACGEGLSLAARAGAVLTDLEFVQFHPTALRTTSDPLPLLTEALRGAGAKLVDSNGNRFMLKLHEMAELAPRDVVSRGVYQAMQNGDVLLDARESIGESFPEKFPTVFHLCQINGFDPQTQLIPIAPAAHYHMGGVAVDLEGKSTVEGLWACGEVSSTGVHGANRLASNSLLEAVVFGKRVAESLKSQQLEITTNPRMSSASKNETESPELVKKLRHQMWNGVGVVRDEAGLEASCAMFQETFFQKNLPRKIRNRTWTCWAIAHAALSRRESRGAHFRSDFPHTDWQLKRHSRSIWEEDAQAWRVEFRQDLIPTGL